MREVLRPAREMRSTADSRRTPRNVIEQYLYVVVQYVAVGRCHGLRESEKPSERRRDFIGPYVG